MFDPASRHPLKADLDPEARALLRNIDPTVGRLLSQYLDHVEGFARLSAVSVSHTEVTAYHDPEEHTDHLVITQWVRLPSEKVVQYWDRLGSVVEQWVRSLDQEEANLVSEWTALEVRPDAADAAA